MASSNRRFLNRQYLLGVFLSTVFLAAAGYLLGERLPDSFEASQTFFVKRQTSKESSSFYTYDGYYSAQAAERFADSLLGSLKSRELLRFLLTASSWDESSLGSLEKAVALIKVRRLSPQLVSISFRGPSRERSQRTVAKLSQGLSQLVQELSRGGDEGISLNLVSREPQIAQKRFSPILFSAVGFLLGGFGWSSFLLLSGYLRGLKS